MRRIVLLVAVATSLLSCSGKVPYLDPALPVETRVQDLLGRMTLDEKIGQMTQIERLASPPGTVKDYMIGSLLSGGGSAPEYNSPQAWREMVVAYQKEALSTRLGIPLLYGIDAVHGNGNVWGSTIFPHHINLGAAGDPELVRRIARAVAEEVSATGILWTFAPCLAVSRDDRWGRVYESFSEDPELTGILGKAEVEGFQEGWPTRGIAATAKHWVGDGATDGGYNAGNVIVDDTTLRTIHIAPYKPAIDAGVATVMPSQSEWNEVECHGNAYLINDILKRELQFKGFVISDWKAIDQLPGDYDSDIVTAINAGVDMVMVPMKRELFMGGLKKAVENGSISMERIDEAVGRILRVKFSLGLFERPLGNPEYLAGTGGAVNRELAREAVRRSAVLLKNDGALPLSLEPGARVVMAGTGVDDIGAQCGGWTVAWEGRRGGVVPGTSIFSAMASMAPEGVEVLKAGIDDDMAAADVIIVVASEDPYVEWEGDRDDLHLLEEDQRVMALAAATGKPVVLILLSGRPMIITDELAMSKAVLAAFLPGSQGEGIADLLWGKASPTAKLPYSWPVNMDQIPVNKGDAEYHPLFPAGYGLRW